ncbi:MAG: hypothetical protein IJ017_01125 [Oscillospiraceae bacterium]|nr:hypothetical protein [Oscillospiraceae bacterium]
MKYSELRPEESGRIVIFGGTMAEKDAFEDAFLINNPSFATEILPELANYKKPKLGRYKTVCDVLVKGLKKSLRKTVLNELIRESKGVNVDGIIYRAPYAMSGGQKLRWSILYNAIMGKKEFLLRDDEVLMDPETAATVESWLMRYTHNSAIIVRITEATGDALGTMLAGGDKGLELVNGDLVTYVKPAPKVTEVPKAEDTKSEEQTKIAKILQMKDKYNGLFSKK